MKTIFQVKAIIAASIFSIFIQGCSSSPEYARVRGYAQGGEYSVTYNRKGVRVEHSAVIHAIDSILTLVDTTLSGYNRNSILSRSNAGEKVTYNDLFMDVFSRCRKYHELTGGALDVAAGPLFDAWGFGFRNSSLPSAETVDSLRAICGMDKILPDLRSSVPGVNPVLNFNAVAQGLTCDLVAGYLHSIGVRDMLVDIGEIYCEGVNAKGNCWKVGVDRPVDGNMTPGADLDGIWQGDGSGCGIVTSGNYRKYYEKDGKKY
ncbi:MAG: FAD:protein FMN transferase, partial [Candidatus Cryptobacteroides sp.]